MIDLIATQLSELFWSDYLIFL